MRKLLNVLYVTTPEAYLMLEGETICVRKDERELLQVPLLNLEGIVTFGYTGASPALMGACAKRNIPICFMTKNGRFLARVTGEIRGNVLLRKRQYEISGDEMASLKIARSMITGKLFNARWVLERALRDHALRMDTERLRQASAFLKQKTMALEECRNLEMLRGYEGNAGRAYFAVLDELILQQKEEFFFHGRNRRPPLDNVNAMLSFIYTLLANEIAAALETVGLDPYSGFLHRDRPGRASLALDLLEELRPVLADRFVLSLINKKQVTGKGFQKQEGGAVMMTDDARKSILASWQEKKQEKITHPYMGEKVSWGLVPYIQAQLLARHLRGDLDACPPFLWK